MTKEELRKKLRDKINNAKNNRTSRAVQEKIQEKEFNTDPRITEEMKTIYNKIKTEYPTLDIKPPNYLLNNVAGAIESFKMYIMHMLEVGKANNILPDELKYTLQNNVYTKYMITVCGIEIVPEKLRFLFTQ